MPVNGKLTKAELEEIARFQTEAVKGKWYWEKTLSILPRQCSVSKHWIRPFSYAMRGERRRNFPAPKLLEVGWIHKDVYLVLKLKGAM